MKKISETDAACRKCRSKYDRWEKKTRGDFDEVICDRSVDLDPVVVFFTNVNV